jgi:hypothetical protein
MGPTGHRQVDMGDKTDMHEVVWPTLATHAMGALPTRLAGRADRHLATCDRCRERLNGYTTAVEQLTIAGEGSSPELIGGWEWARERVRRHAQPNEELRASGDC